MPTKYTHNVLIAIPESMTERANHWACCMFESAADINTFREPNYRDALGNLYVVRNAKVTDEFLAAFNDTSKIPWPEHAKGLVHKKTAEDVHKIDARSTFFIAIDVEPHSQLAAWGLERIVPRDDG